MLGIGRAGYVDTAILVVVQCPQPTGGKESEHDRDKTSLPTVAVDICECLALDSGMVCDAVEYMGNVGIEWERCQHAAEYIIPDSGLKICPECRNGCYNGEGQAY